MLELFIATLIITQTISLFMIYLNKQEIFEKINLIESYKTAYEKLEKDILEEMDDYERLLEKKEKNKIKKQKYYLANKERLLKWMSDRYKRNQYLKNNPKEWVK